MSEAMINQIILLFALLITGAVSNRAGILNAEANARLSSLLLKVTLPAYILKSAFDNHPEDKMMVVMIVAVAVGVFMLATVMSIIFTKIFKMDNTYQLMLDYSNLGFMGFPIITGVYGEAAAIYGAVFLMAFNLHIYTVGVIILQKRTESLGVMLKKLLSPGIISALLALVIVFADLSAPTVVTGFLGSVGGVTTPLAMMVIGSQLAMVDILKSFSNKKLYIMSFAKLVLYPTVVFIVLKLIFGKGLICDIPAILFGLPTAGNVTMLCSEYGGDISLAAEGTCISTVLSLATIPVMLTVIGMF